VVPASWWDLSSHRAAEMWGNGLSPCPGIFTCQLERDGMHPNTPRHHMKSNLGQACKREDGAVGFTSAVHHTDMTVC
jgi:hypothetical protein